MTWAWDAWGFAVWGGLEEEAAESTVSPVVVAHILGVATAPAIEGRASAFSVSGEAPSFVLPVMRVGG